MATVPEGKRNNKGKDGVIVPVIKKSDRREEWREQYWDDVMDIIVAVFWIVGICYAFVVGLKIFIDW